jgi:hypothetical protein
MSECRGHRGILRHAALFLIILIPGLKAQPLVWGAQSIRQTGIAWSSALPVLSPSGDVYLAGSPSLTKVDATGRTNFSVQITGEDDAGPIFLGPDQSVYLTGYANPNQFVTTQGAYKSSAAGNSPAPFLCKLSGVNGHLLFCTYVDAGNPSIAADTLGNSYVLGSSCGSVCIQKLSPAGALVYQSPAATFTSRVFRKIPFFSRSSIPPEN